MIPPQVCAVFGQIIDSTLTFTTDTSNANAASNGSFFVGGDGALPTSYHGRLGAQCDIEICNYMEDDVTIHALPSDAWKFTMTGQYLDKLVSYRPAPGVRKDIVFYQFHAMVFLTH